ncbi:cell division topological specificity factor MinE, partial [Paracoccus litorisediminis]
KPNPAQTAKERLQILLAHERAGGTSPDFLPLLQRDILEVVRRHMEIDGEQVEVKLERGAELSSLEINIELPGATKLKKKAG